MLLTALNCVIVEKTARISGWIGRFSRVRTGTKFIQSVTTLQTGSDSKVGWIPWNRNSRIWWKTPTT